MPPWTYFSMRIERRDFNFNEARAVSIDTRGRSLLAALLSASALPESRTASPCFCGLCEARGDVAEQLLGL